MESGCWTEAFFITLGGPQAHEHFGRDDTFLWEPNYFVSDKCVIPTEAQRSGPVPACRGATCCFLIFPLDLFIFDGLYGMPEDLLEALGFHGVGFAVVFIDFIAIAHAWSGKSD
jgi:hypothetical protein